MFLSPQKQLGDRLLKGGFSSGSKVPYSDVNLMTETGHSPRWSPYSSLSEVTTIQLEFKDLSKATGNNVYAVSFNIINSSLLLPISTFHFLSLTIQIQLSRVCQKPHFFFFSTQKKEKLRI